MTRSQDSSLYGLDVPDQCSALKKNTHLEDIGAWRSTRLVRKDVDQVMTRERGSINDGWMKFLEGRLRPRENE